jgi:hypothetical protein
MIDEVEIRRSGLDGCQGERNKEESKGSRKMHQGFSWAQNIMNPVSRDLLPTPLRQLRILTGIFSLLLVSVWLCHAGQSHQLTLMWDENSEEDVVGYRLYYGNQSRQYPWHEELEREVCCKDGLCSAFVDLPSGHWFFSVTAVDALGRESGYSEEVDAVLANRAMSWLILLLGD